MLFNCTFPGCDQEVSPEKAVVPPIQAIKQAQGDRGVSIQDLADHVFCEEHAELAGHYAPQLRLFPYLKTVEELVRRRKEKETAQNFFAKYSPQPAQDPPRPKPGEPVAAKGKDKPPKNNAMSMALKGAGLKVAS